jgi:conjugative relaxase-like TrwC/TraI family protein
VLKIHVVRDGGYRYYVNDLVPGRAEGTLVAGESPGTWSGAGSASLGLRGRVDAQAFAELLEGRDPVSGQALRNRRGDRGVSGYDLTFCAPKSVSLLHLLAPREMADEVGAGHQSAVAEAISYLDRAAVGVRRTRNGQVNLMAATGLVSGQFVHRTSRTLDPHLHTHVVAANVAQGVDGAWSSVDSRRVYAHLRAIRGVYHARLRGELTERLGVAWEVPPSGLGDVVGVDETLRRLFSQRSADMDEYVHRHPGRTDEPRQRRLASHVTRPDKDRSRTVDGLAAEWRTRAAEFGYQPGDLTRVVGLGRGVAAGPAIDGDRLHARLDQIAAKGRSLAHRDLVAEVAAAATAGAPAQVIESFATGMTRVAGAAADGVARSECSFQAAIGSTSHPGDLRWKAGDLARVLDRQLEAWGSGPGDRLASSVGIDRSEAGFRREVRRVGDHGERVSVSIQLGR